MFIQFVILCVILSVCVQQHEVIIAMISLHHYIADYVLSVTSLAAMLATRSLSAIDIAVNTGKKIYHILIYF